MRVALIGPVPPALGGATPGGVATHQVQLAAGLAAAGVEAPLLATNVRRSWVDPHPPDPPLPISGRGGSQSFPISEREGSEPFPISGRDASERQGRQSFPTSGREGTQSLPTSGEYWTGGDVNFPVYGMGGWTGWARVVPYALYLARTRMPGSRREVLRNLLGYRGFLIGVRPEVIHVQHPLERCLYVRMVQQLEGWRVPLVVTAHSLFGEHSEETIYGLMAPNLRAADRVIAVSDHIAEQAIELGVARERVKVIRSGVDVERFRPRDRHDARQRLGIHHDIPVVLFVGNLEPRKQVDVLLRAMQRVQESLPEATLVVIGSGRSAGAEDQTDRLISLSRRWVRSGATRIACAYRRWSSLGTTRQGLRRSSRRSSQVTSTGPKSRAIVSSTIARGASPSGMTITGLRFNDTPEPRDRPGR